MSFAVHFTTFLIHFVPYFSFIRQFWYNLLFFEWTKNVKESCRLESSGLFPPFLSPRVAVMLHKAKKKTSVLNVPAHKNGRGRPRKHIDPKAFHAFEENIAATEFSGEYDENFQPTAPSQKQRRMNPATGDQCYTDDEIEFMNALSEFKRASGRTFPTCSEILGVLRSLGYVKVM